MSICPRGLIKKLFQIVLVVGLLGGCDQTDLIDGLDNRQSIEISVALYKAGVSAKREKSSTSRSGSRTGGSSEKYSLLVDEKDYQRALAVIKELGFPRNQEETLESITEQKGFVPNTKEMSALRLDHALGLEVERLLFGLTGVNNVKAVVRSNSSASIVVQFMEEPKDTPVAIDNIKRLVMQAVPGLSWANIQVTTTSVDPALLNNKTFSEGRIENEADIFTSLSPLPVYVLKDEKKTAQVQLSLFVFGICFSGLIVGVGLGWKFRNRRFWREHELQIRTEKLKSVESNSNNTAKQNNIPYSQV